MLLIYPTVVIGLEVIYHRPYAELIALSTAAFVAFGVFSLPAGWLADRWSRRNMMAAFYIGCGVSLDRRGGGAQSGRARGRPVRARRVRRDLSPGRHADAAGSLQAQGRTVAFNGVCGNLGAALAAGVTAAIASWLGWRAAFLVPALVCIATGIAYVMLVPDDRHRTASRKKTADVVLSQRAAMIMFGLYVVISLAGGLTFNTISIALPKIVDERLGADVPLLLGRLGRDRGVHVRRGGADRGRPPGRVDQALSTVRLHRGGCSSSALLWAANASGMTLILALAVTMAAIYGQVTVGDLVIARYTADAWRGRVYPQAILCAGLYRRVHDSWFCGYRSSAPDVILRAPAACSAGRVATPCWFRKIRSWLVFCAISPGGKLPASRTS